MNRTDARVAVQRLPAHLMAQCGTEVTQTHELDLGVYRVDRREGASWVARLFPATRPLAQTQGDAEILELLASLGYPAERCATAEPVSILEGQALLVMCHAVSAAPRSVPPAGSGR